MQCFNAAPPNDLPDHVFFRTAKQSFNSRWYVALHDGLIWVKPNPQGGRPDGPWTKLGSGLPAGPELVRFAPPTRIAEISADGIHLQALSTDGVFYRGTDFTNDDLRTFSWTDKWGHPAAEGYGLRAEFPTTHGWSVSDSLKSGVGWYEDRNGTKTDIGLGAAHLYRLGPTGRSLVFNDWWLPNDWSREFCLPDRGTFTAENLSTSASTTFVVNRQGQMYTRLYDFDTSGEDDLLIYSYLVTGPSGTTRALPNEGWRRQPDITDGLITRNITIFQTGQGNAARTLRVEGVKGGKTGFFTKGIFDADWSFQETGLPVCGPLMNEPPAAPIAPEDVRMTGTLSRDPHSVGLELVDFNVVCSPARVRLSVGGTQVTVAGQPLELALHHVQGMSRDPVTMPTRETGFWRNGTPARIRGALLLPATLQDIDDPGARAAVTALFQRKKVVNFMGTATPHQVRLEEISWATTGYVPGDEKSDLFGSPFRLTADQ